MTSQRTFSATLAKLQRGETLPADQSAAAFTTIMSGDITVSDIAAFLTVLAQRDPTIGEITGGVRAMRAAMQTIEAPENAIDLCGTGGDGHGTLNISTATAFVVAACGVPIAKHGNRSASSRSGTADVLELLGVKIDMAPRDAEACLQSTNFCFLFAPNYHTAMRHVAQARKQLGFRTIFNLLGPLANPASVRRQLIGVFAADWIEPFAHVLNDLGGEKAWVVHGADGLDELTTTEATDVAELTQGSVTRRRVSPEDIGLPRAALSAIKGGDAAHNAGALRRLLDGERGAFRDIVVLNAAAALVVAGRTADLAQGASLAEDALDDGAAKAVLEKVATLSRKVAA